MIDAALLDQTRQGRRPWVAPEAKVTKVWKLYPARLVAFLSLISEETQVEPDLGGTWGGLSWLPGCGMGGY